MIYSILNFQITGYCIMVAIFYGEITNPIRMIWVELSKRNNKYSNPVFILFKYSFIGIRLVIIPYYMVYAIYYFIYKSDKVLSYMTALYIILFTIITSGNIIWSYQLLKTKNS